MPPDTQSRSPSTPPDEVELVPTEEDDRVWTEVYGFTPDDIATMARYIEVPEEKVTRLVELAHFMRTLPKREVRS